MSRILALRLRSKQHHYYTQIFALRPLFPGRLFRRRRIRANIHKKIMCSRASQITHRWIDVKTMLRERMSLRGQKKNRRIGRLETSSLSVPNISIDIGSDALRTTRHYKRWSIPYTQPWPFSSVLAVSPIGDARYLRNRARPKWLRVTRTGIHRESIKHSAVRFIPSLLDWLPQPQLSRWRTARSITLRPALSYIRMVALWRSIEFVSYVKSFIWFHPLSRLSSNIIPWHFRKRQKFIHFVLRTGFHNTFLTVLLGKRIIYQTTPGQHRVFKTARTRNYIGRLLAKYFLANNKLDIILSKCRTQQVSFSARGLFVHISIFLHKLHIYRRGISRDSNYFFRMYIGWIRKKQRIMFLKELRHDILIDRYLYRLRKVYPFINSYPENIFSLPRFGRAARFPTMLHSSGGVRDSSQTSNDLFSRKRKPGRLLRRGLRSLRFKWTNVQASKYGYSSSLTSYNYARLMRTAFMFRQTRKPYNGVRRMRLLRNRNVSSVRFRRRKKRRGKRRKR